MAEREPEVRASDPSAAAEPVASGDGSEPVTLQALLEAARADAEQQSSAAQEFKTLLQRVQADFVNYKRRMEAERETRADAARAETIAIFLPVVDDFERALEHVPESSPDSWIQGFKLIDRNLAAVFERLGLTRVGEVGELFDPKIH